MLAMQKKSEEHEMEIGKYKKKFDEMEMYQVKKFDK